MKETDKQKQLAKLHAKERLYFEIARYDGVNADLQKKFKTLDKEFQTLRDS